MKLRLLFAACLAVAASAVAACGGGGGSPNPLPSATTIPTSTPTAPTGTPTPATTTGALPTPPPGSTQLSLTLTAPGGGTAGTFAANVTTPSLVPPGTTYTATTSYSAGAAPALPSADGTALAYVSLQFNNDTVLSGLGPFSIDVPSPASGMNYYIGFNDPTNTSLGWQQNIFGAGTVSGSTITFNAIALPNNADFDFSALQVYWFVLYAVPSGSSQPPQTTPTGHASAGCVGGPLIVKRRPMSSASPFPIGSGDSFNYQGTLLDTTAVSAPCPQPTATAAASVGIAVSDSPTAAPDGTSAQDVHTVEQDQYALSGLSQTTTDAIEEDTASQALLYSTSSTDGSGNTVATAYAAPQVIDEFPEAGGKSWTNDSAIAATTTETLADGGSVRRTTNADGTYNETDTFGSISATIADGADDSGSYNVFGQYQLAYAAPSNGVITLTINAGGVSKARDLLQWWPAKMPLYSDAFQDNGQQSFASVCPSAYSGAGTTGEQIVETVTQLDPVLGYTDVRTITRYDVTGYGPACVTINDTEKQYYDYQFNTVRSDYQAIDAQPLQTDTIAQTYWLNAAPTVSSTGRHPMDARRADLFIAGRVAAIAQERALERAALVRGGLR